MEQEIKKIVVIGPESTGKSTLCEQLSQHYHTSWVREYAREYLEQNGADYAFEDLYEIAKGQVGGEDAEISEIKNSKLKIKNLFIDTDLYVIKVWSEFVFNKIDNRILTEIAKREYDLYLLCDVDLPWIKDELREYPDLSVREKLFHYYKEEMTEQKTPWIIIRGNYEERLAVAVAAADQLF